MGKFYKIARIIISIKFLLSLWLIVAVFVTGYSLNQPTPNECSTKNWDATYISWDEEAGPCTALQQTTFNLFYAFAFPFIVGFPITIGALTYLAISVARKKIRHIQSAVTMLLLLPIFMWLGMLLMISMLSVMGN